MQFHSLGEKQRDIERQGERDMEREIYRGRRRERYRETKRENESPVFQKLVV